jgi:hypothetical protein
VCAFKKKEREEMKEIERKEMPKEKRGSHLG